jgi:predicted amidophosphoribosyltransferase
MALRNTVNKVRNTLVDNLWNPVTAFLLDLFWPIRCVSCKQIGTWLCYDCFAALKEAEQLCTECGEPAVGGFTHVRCSKPWGLDRVWASYLYNSPAKDLVAHLKYRNCRDVSTTVVGLMTELFSDDLKAFSGFYILFLFLCIGLKGFRGGTIRRFY